MNECTKTRPKNRTLGSVNATCALRIMWQSANRIMNWRKNSSCRNRRTGLSTYDMRVPRCNPCQCQQPKQQQYDIRAPRCNMSMSTAKTTTMQHGDRRRLVPEQSCLPSVAGPAISSAILHSACVINPEHCSHVSGLISSMPQIKLNARSGACKNSVKSPPTCDVSIVEG